MSAIVIPGDCRTIIAGLVDQSIDAIVTDPPYEIGFMGRRWDASGIAYDVDLWAECLRVLKPGGHLLAFGGTRTYHRMTVAIEDAGFEIRDSIHWLYGSGFPKSLDVSKAIDKAAGHWRGKAGEVVSANGAMSGPNYARTDRGEPVTAAAAAAAGWGTALKPAHEPIVVARKPLAGTVAANVLEHGTGALNIDGTRIAANDRFGGGTRGSSGFASGYDGDGWTAGNDLGRWPANIVLTHAPDCADDDCGPDCPVALLDQQSGNRPGGNFPTHRGRGVATAFGKGRPTEGGARSMGDSGGASRFFTVTDWDPFLYTAKPSRRERDAGLTALPEREVHRLGAGIGGGNDPSAPAVNRNSHPTVKPLALMRWLVRLVTPPGGTVLDPFAGSGTTLAAAILEGFDAIGCELTDDYLPIIEKRIAWAEAERAKDHPNLFGDAA